MTFTDKGREAVPRTEDGRPLIIPPEGGDPVPYGQPSALGGVLLDTSNLQKWRERHILEGVQMSSGLHPVKGLNAPLNDLLVEIKRADGDRNLLNAIADEAFERSGGTYARDFGTTLHNRTERHDKGFRMKMARDMDLDFSAYVQLTKGMKFEAIETFVVNDEILHAGSPDRVCNGVICDLKTGSNIFKQQIEMAVQFATYAHADYYNPKNGARKRGDFNLKLAYIFWVRDGVARLVRVDIARGWELAKLAYKVLQVREQETGFFNIVQNTESARRTNVALWLEAEILLRAQTREHIDELWSKNKKYWTPGLSAVAANRLVQMDSQQ